MSDPDVDEAKAALSRAIGGRLESIANGIASHIAELDDLRQTAGFVNGLAAVCASAKRALEVEARKIRDEKADVHRALNERPTITETVDAVQAEAARKAR